MPGIVTAGERVTPSMFSFTISNLATGQVTSATAETVIGSLTIPSAPVANQGYEFHIEGTNDNTTGSPTVTFRFRLGTAGTTADLNVMSFPAIQCIASAQANLPWSVSGWLRVTTAGTSGTVFMTATHISDIATLPTVLLPNINNPSGTVNWNNGGGNFLTVTAQWSAASASNTTRTLSGSLAALN